MCSKTTKEADEGICTSLIVSGQSRDLAPTTCTLREQAGTPAGGSSALVPGSNDQTEQTDRKTNQ